MERCFWGNLRLLNYQSNSIGILEMLELNGLFIRLTIADRTIEYKYQSKLILHYSVVLVFFKIFK